MTIDNYTSNQDLLKAISEINKRPDVLDRFLKNHHPTLHSELVSRTKFLDEGYFKGKSVPILARMYCLEHDLTSSPTCQNPDCDNPVEWRNGFHIFAPYCCRQCYLDDPNSHHKEEETKRIKYNDPYFCNRKKYKENMLKKHGVEHFSQTKEWKDKFLKTCNDKFGGNAPACSSEVVEKMKRTKEERYGDPGFNNHEKAVVTLNNQYGVSNVSQIPGVQDKVKITSISKYDKPHYNQSEEYRSRIPEIRQKMTKKWVLFWNDDNTYVSTRRDGEEYNANVGKWQHELQMDSSWEIDLFVFCRLKNGLDVDYQPNMTIPYEYDGETHSYHPDFIINGRIVEVKGDNFFRINEETGKEEMYCTWRDPNWSDDYYKWRCGREEAKHQCMIANDVVILRHIEMNNLNIEMFNCM